MTPSEIIALIKNEKTRSKGATILNAIINEAYDMHLVTCPQCEQIHSFFPGNYEHIHTCICGTEFKQDKAPDLFD